MAVKGEVDLHALYAGGAQPTGEGDAASGQGGRYRKGVKYKCGQQQQQQQQQQPHQQPQQQ